MISKHCARSSLRSHAVINETFFSNFQSLCYVERSFIQDFSPSFWHIFGSIFAKCKKKYEYISWLWCRKSREVALLLCSPYWRVVLRKSLWKVAHLRSAREAVEAGSFRPIWDQFLSLALHIINSVSNHHQFTFSHLPKTEYIGVDQIQLCIGMYFE